VVGSLSSKLRAYRRITADQILQARQMTEITFSAFPDAILALSVDGKIDFANPTAEETVSHELKTPLSSIRMGLHLL
jgi:PAS domain-containing protein